MNCKVMGVALCLAAVMAAPGVVSAQTQFDQVKATPKGTVGLGLVGAELGLIIPSVAGLDEAWALTVFPIVGAAGGALAGYFLIDDPGKEKLAVGALALGMAGLIPAVMLTVKATRYDPDDDRSFQAQLKAERAARAGPGLLRRTERGLSVAMPGVAIDTSRSKGARVALFSGVF